MSENIQLAIMPLEHYQNACNTIREKVRVLINGTFSEKDVEIPGIHLDLDKEYDIHIKVYQNNYDQKEITEFNIEGKPREYDLDSWGFLLSDELPITTSGGGEFYLYISNIDKGLSIFWEDVSNTGLFTSYQIKIQEKDSKILSKELSNKIEEVYNNGEKKGFDDGYKIGYYNGDNDGYSEGYSKGLIEGEEEGKLKRESDWWASYQTKGTRTNYANAFFNFGWTDETYQPQYPINSTSSSNMFAWSHIIDTKVPIKISDTDAASAVFSNCKLLEIIQSLDITNYNQTYINWFTNCENLKNITIIGYFKKNVDFKESKKLTKEGITNIVNALDPNGLLGNELTLYLSEAAVDKAFVEYDGIMQIFGSATQAWADLKATKPNWKIELV